MLLQGWDVAVKRVDWESAKRGNASAIRNIRNSLNGVRLYFHSLTMTSEEANSYEIVTLQTLIELGIVTGVTIEAGGEDHGIEA